MTKPETFLLIASAVAIAAVLAGALFYMRTAGHPRSLYASLHDWFPSDEPVNPVTQVEAEIVRHRIVATAALVAAAGLLMALVRALRRSRRAPAPNPYPPYDWPGDGHGRARRD